MDEQDRERAGFGMGTNERGGGGGEISPNEFLLGEKRLARLPPPRSRTYLRGEGRDKSRVSEISGEVENYFFDPRKRLAKHTSVRHFKPFPI